MKLAEATGTVVRDGIGAESNFKIAATAKAFEILSARLYTDIPRAIVRELSTNAHDAHVEAGRGDKPFDVHLPNYMESWFEIRDYGPGLSPEAVIQIYTVYFASTRNTSNEFAGCLGLGSKSPFAYTDAFTVTSYVNGVAYVYSLFKNEKQEPSITKMSETATTEPNGVAIRIAVKSQDHSAFVRAAEKVYRYFKVKPNIKGASINTTLPKPEIQGGFYAIRSEGGYSNNGSLSIVMGQVCYKVSSINPTYHGFEGYDTAVDLYANIGECETAASREEIHMSKGTESWITAKLAEVIEDIGVRAKAEAEKATTTLDKVRIQNHYAARVARLPNGIRLVGDAAGQYMVRRMDVRTDRKGRRSLYIENHGYNFDRVRKQEVVIIEDDSGQDDLPLKLRARLTHYMMEQAKTRQDTAIFMLAKVFERAAFEKDFGKPTETLTALPEPPKDRSIIGVTMERNKSCIRRLTQGGRWENVTQFEEGEGIAIVLRDGNDAKMGEREIKVGSLQRLMQQLDIKVVYGIPTRVMNKYDGDLPDIFELAKEKLDKLLAGLTKYELAILKHGRPNGHTELLEKLKDLSPICEDYYNLQVASDNFSTHGEILSLMGLFGIEPVDSQNFESIFNAKYPLVLSVETGFGDRLNTTAEELKTYIKAKDKSK
jgi:hypothetical protein